MKKVTVILSMFVFAITSQSFAQNAARPAALKIKPAEPKPGEKGYKATMSDVLVSSAKTKETAKPAAKPIAPPAKPSKATIDFYIKIDGVNGESKNK